MQYFHLSTYYFTFRRRSAPAEIHKVEDYEDEDADIDDLDDDVYLPPPTSTNKDLSPTQSVRSLILRPRSTPIRRATISAGSPSKHQPYMNVSEIWTASSLYDTARSTKSNNSDGLASKHSSASSTMHSSDSGCATMYSTNQDGLLVNKISSEYINLHQPKEDYINLFACSTLETTATAAGKRQPPPPPLLPKRKFLKANFVLCSGTADITPKNSVRSQHYPYYHDCGFTQTPKFAIS